jgi:hypothetical protein
VTINGSFPDGWAEDPFDIDHTVAHASRVYDYLLGGVDNFESDREAAAQLGMALGGIEKPRRDVRANRNFLVRAVHFLVREAGIRQFLDVGTGVPNADNTHAVARDLAPDSSIVYVDNDPIVLAHSHKLLRGIERTDYMAGDLRQPDLVLERAAKTLDFDRPIGLMLISVMHFVDPEDDPYGIVDRFRAALPAGSYLALSHLTGDIQPDTTVPAAAVLSQAPRENFNLRDHAEVARFFGDFDLVDPGVVAIDDWRPDDDLTPQPVPGDDGRRAPFYAGVARRT